MRRSPTLAPRHTPVALATFVACSVTAALAGCGDSTPRPVSIKVERDGEVLLECKDAAPGQLMPIPGGWRFDCPGGAGGLFVMYSTGEGPANGTVKEIEVTKADKTREKFLAGGDPNECPGVVMDKGPAGFAVDQHERFTAGTTEFAMGHPCTTLKVTLEP